MRLFALTIFVSSFLLFQVQPMIGKAILPWFGGTPAVWTTCMLFFQTALLGGYAYAHWLSERFAPSRQAVIHIGVLLVSLLWLPVAPDDALKPADASWPAPRVMWVLFASVGGPFLAVSSTAPLLQSWFSRAFPDRSPYRLYALSNVGSLLGLFAYPFVVERTLSLPQQSWMWSGGYLVFAMLCGATAWRLRRSAAAGEPDHRAPVAAAATVGPARLGGLDTALWLALSACGSAVLLAVTNQLCQNVAAVPFLWVLPLGLYLVTFILCFDSDGWYRRGLFALGWLGALGAGLWMVLGGSPPLAAQIALYCGILFVCCMICHGELARLRPEPRRLTRYFFLISTGGALGGVFVSLVAPVIFDRFHEFHVVLFGTGLLLLLIFRRDRWQTLEGAALRRSVARTVAAAAGLAVCVGIAYGVARWAGLTDGAGSLSRDRNFYGIVSAQSEPARDPRGSVVSFTHGNTTHGFQFALPERRAEPTGYYQTGSGVGVALARHPRRLAGEPMRLGLIGLGVGTLAAYARPGDTLVFYEIDPQVERYARQYFTFLADAEARGAILEVRLGDARILLERELSTSAAPADGGGGNAFDILVLDAFSSDAVPAHLLTAECFALYRRHLAPGGVLASHVSNRHLDLVPVVRGSAAAAGLETAQVWHQTPADSGLPGPLQLHSHWILATAAPDFFQQPEVSAALTPWEPTDATLRWTDDFSSLYQVLR